MIMPESKRAGPAGNMLEPGSLLFLRLLKGKKNRYSSWKEGL